MFILCAKPEVRAFKLGVVKEDSVSFLFDSAFVIPTLLMTLLEGQSKASRSQRPTAVETPATACTSSAQGNAFSSVLTIAIHPLNEETIFFFFWVSFTWQSAQVFDVTDEWW